MQWIGYFCKTYELLKGVPICVVIYTLADCELYGRRRWPETCVIGGFWRRFIIFSYWMFRSIDSLTDANRKFRTKNQSKHFPETKAHRRRAEPWIHTTHREKKKSSRINWFNELMAAKHNYSPVTSVSDAYHQCSINSLVFSNGNEQTYTVYLYNVDGWVYEFILGPHVFWRLIHIRW